MSALMDVDSTHEDPQTGSLSNAHEAKLQLNTRVMNAIQKRKANNPNSLFVSSRCFTANDAPTLLHILLEIHSGKDEVPMTISQYHQYLMDNVELLEDLLSAYTSKNYEELMDHRKWGSQFYSECYALVDVSSQHLKINVGNTAKLFIDTLNRERLLPTGQAAANRPYNWSISVVQSSGMGKSRMVEEAANTVFTIPINIREKLPEGRISDISAAGQNIREFFLKRQSLSDKQQQADYMLFFKLLFDKTHEVVQDCFSGITGSDLALAWAKYLNKGQNIVEVGTKRKLFYDSVIKDADLVSSVSVGISSIGRNSRYQQSLKINEFSLSEIETSMQKSCQTLLELIQPGSSNQDNICLLYFDEAHSLTESVKTPDEEHEQSQYHNLGIAIASLIDYRLFFIFLSTNSRLENFAPAPTSFPSDRVTNGSRLIPPFTELPFDIYESTVLDDIKILSLESVSKTEVMVGFGRALWYSYHKSNPNKNIFDLAVDKLTASGVNDRNSDALLAVLGVRIGIAFNATNNTTYSIQSRLVESHLRVVYWIPEHQGYMYTGAPSEPILAEAAARYLNASNSDRKGIAVLGPRRLSEEIKKGLLARGERGEIAGRLLVTAAYEAALTIDSTMNNRKPWYHKPIPVMDFLFALFHSNHHDLIKGARSLTGLEGVPTLNQAFANCHVFFSHFALAEDADMLSSTGLAIALVRGMALQAKDGHESIDAVIPVHIGSVTSPIDPSTTSAINLQFKNRQRPMECNFKRSTTVPDLKLPVISIVFELGITGSIREPITIVQEPRGPTRSGTRAIHPDDHHYQIIVKGCSGKVFGVISDEAEAQYKAILGTASILQDFPRNKNKDNAEALLAMKPAFSAARQNRLYGKQWKL
ncbi:hypothetical protein RHS01_10436 [Rhizoctonia solani]|uniref:Uncharacterized protein n=1 Tax=Rhizoctonia solani TaxID=456999 RepID=A0A8H7I5I0_9AGAM|nr:hypothetical protein RHS01_10436 [Rhizoctonia solani]